MGILHNDFDEVYKGMKKGDKDIVRNILKEVKK